MHFLSHPVSLRLPCRRPLALSGARCPSRAAHCSQQQIASGSWRAEHTPWLCVSPFDRKLSIFFFNIATIAFILRFIYRNKERKKKKRMYCASWTDRLKVSWSEAALHQTFRLLLLCLDETPLLLAPGDMDGWPRAHPLHRTGELKKKERKRKICLKETNGQKIGETTVNCSTLT